METETLDITEFDRDEAVAEAVDGLTRGGVLRRGALLAGALLPGAGIAWGRNGGTRKRDVEILNFALTLEELQAEFYALALRHARGARLGPKTRLFAETAAAHEAAHVAALRRALGSRAVAKPRFDFKHTTRRADSFLLTAKVLEDLGVAAYAGQGPRIHRDAVLAPAAAILAVEARHAAWVRRLIGGADTSVLPAPAAFDKPLPMDAVRSAIDLTGFIKA